MKKPILFVDLDNVVFDTVGTIKAMYDEDFRLYDDYEWVPAHKIKQYDFSDLKYMTKDRLAEYFNSGRFFDRLQYIDGAIVSVVTILHTFSDFPVVFLSIGTPENLRGKRLWVQNLNKSMDTNIKFIGVDRENKSHIDMSGGILIDDELKNLENSSAALNICFGDYEWNKDWYGYRANNWEEVRALIAEEVKRNVCND